MISPAYLNLSRREQMDYIAKVLIMAQSAELYDFFIKRVQDCEAIGFFEVVAPADPSHPHIKDLDAGPIENGPSSPQN